MKLNKNKTGLVLLLLCFAACKKMDFDTTNKGEALANFRLGQPANNLALVLNPATPNNTVVISWGASKPGVSTAPTYKWIAAVKATGNLDSPLLEIPSDDAGKSTTLTLTQKQIDDALAAKGITAGAKTDLIWSVNAENGTTTLRSQDIFNISITRMKDGASSFVLLGPASSTSSVAIDPGSTSSSFVFNWTRSVPAAGSPAVVYKILFAEKKLDAGGNEQPVNWSSPLFSILSDNSGIDSIATISYKQLSDSLNAHGLTDFSQVSNLKWTVTASAGTWNQQADYVNDFVILRQVKFFLVGNITGWDINNPWELITDQKPDRYGKVFYTYFKVPADGAQFLFIKEKGNWGSKYGITGGGGQVYDVGYNTGSDFVISTPGIYRLTIDIGNSKAYIQEKQVGVVGDMQGWNPGAPIFGGYINRDQFLIITPTNGNDGFKFHDGPVWDNSNPGVARWWGSVGNTSNLDIDGNGANIVANTAPYTRLIWNGTNGQQLKFEKSPASEMRLVGDGIDKPGVADWSPGTSPQMTYLGNGKWQITIGLKAGKAFKFLSGDAWGAFEYSDNGDGGSGSTIVRKTKWGGGDNFNTPSVAGTYTITLDEYAQTASIN